MQFPQNSALGYINFGVTGNVGQLRQYGQQQTQNKMALWANVVLEINHWHDIV